MWFENDYLFITLYDLPVFLMACLYRSSVLAVWHEFSRNTGNVPFNFITADSEYPNTFKCTLSLHTQSFSSKWALQCNFWCCNSIWWSTLPPCADLQNCMCASLLGGHWSTRSHSCYIIRYFRLLLNQSGNVILKNPITLMDTIASLNSPC